MAAPFEDPAKGEMRAEARAALDQAGHEECDPPKEYALGDHIEGLKGVLSGDIQTLDSNGTRHLFFLRTRSKGPLPQWLSNYLRAANSISGVEGHVVVRSSDAAMVAACQAVGAGLILLRDGPTLDVLQDARDLDPNAVRDAFLERSREARRRLDNKVQMNLRSVESQFAQMDQLTAGMPHRDRARWKAAVEAKADTWHRWNDEVTARLDRVDVSLDSDELEAIERDILEGPE